MEHKGSCRCTIDDQPKMSSPPQISRRMGLERKQILAICPNGQSSGGSKEVGVMQWRWAGLVYLPGTGHSPKGWYGQEAHRGQTGLELAAAQAATSRLHSHPSSSPVSPRAPTRSSLLAPIPPRRWNLFVYVRAHLHPVTVTLQGGKGCSWRGC